MLSHAAIYCIRGLIYIASRQDRTFIPISEVSKFLNISFHFLTKIFQKLTKNDILISNRGPKGGVSFKRSPDTIFVIELVNIIDGPEIFDKCVLGLPGCGSDAPCPMHDHWSIVKKHMQDQFKNTTIAELAAKVSDRNERIR